MESISAVQLWTGRVLSGIVVAFFVLDSIGKLLKVGPVVEGTVKLGYPESAVFTLGMLLLVGVVLYVFPRTSVLGAIYLTAFLGGAVATHFRVGSPLATHVLFGVYIAALMWTGLALRNPRVMQFLMGSH
jgi:DoxX-like family